MTTPPTLDPAVEEVLVDLAKAKERTLFTCDPATLARNLGGANAVISANATGLLPVERHLLATMRNEVLELLLCAAREAMLDTEVGFVVPVRPLVGFASWRASVGALLVDRRLGSLPAAKQLAAMERHGGFLYPFAAHALSVARELSDSPRVHVYIAWEQLQRHAFIPALRTVDAVALETSQPLLRRSASEVACAALSSLGDDRGALRACLDAIRLSEESEDPSPMRALLHANALCCSLRADDIFQARASAIALDRYNDLAELEAVKGYARFLRRIVLSHGCNVRFDRVTARALEDSNVATREVCIALR